jgi:hypothetical protein
MNKKSGQERVWKKAGVWSDRALDLLAIYAFKSKGEFTMNEFREYAIGRGLEEPYHPNCWGALPAVAAKQLIIKPSGNMFPSERKEAHHRLIRGWVRA